MGVRRDASLRPYGKLHPADAAVRVVPVVVEHEGLVRGLALHDASRHARLRPLLALPGVALEGFPEGQWCDQLLASSMLSDDEQLCRRSDSVSVNSGSNVGVKGGPLRVESGCGAWPEAGACLLPPLSSGGALVAQP